MELTKSDIEAIAKKRYAKSLNRRWLMASLIMLLFMLPCLLLPDPFGKILVIALAIPPSFILMRYSYKEDIFVKDFIHRWESGEITFSSEDK